MVQEKKLTKVELLKEFIGVDTVSVPEITKERFQKAVEYLLECSRIVWDDFQDDSGGAYELLWDNSGFTDNEIAFLDANREELDSIMAIYQGIYRDIT